MGYFQVVNQFNIGKKSEFYSREYFSERKTLDRLAIAEQNQSFCEKYS